MTGEQLAKLAVEILPQKWGYIYGKAGIMWTQALQDELNRTTAEKYASGRKYGAKWIGHMVTDCSGLVVYLCKKYKVSVPHGSNSMWDGSLSKRGKISSNELPVGALVFKLRGADDYYHVGIYVGGGKVIEAKSTYYGVVESKLSTWTHYGLLKALKYESKEVKPLKTGAAVVDTPNKGTVNVRKSASKSALKIDALNYGETCEVVDVVGDWAKVEYTKTGYIMAKYLQNV